MVFLHRWVTAMVLVLCISTLVRGNKCITPVGSPCSPREICIETVEGYDCQDLYNKFSCPVTCSNGERCVQDKATGVHSCQCKESWHRPVKGLKCVPQGKTLIKETTGFAASAASTVRFRLKDE